ncbi:major facilitator transporter [Devosia epidermidihirudinis]|uniref:Major facilitator transporter n=1 Tax=Devosia epidermidihirudinis TaxID=1293439 RepID=A0A0F5QAR0_9HYPH|nr:MFS transporter [Devosia epidermidihirudinis]KKC37816.1 major facilitator transporter [Devosia epidermidihirudinis]
MNIAPQHRIYACFFLFAFALGALLSRMPDLQTHLQVTEGQLGMTIIGMSVGSLLSLTFSAPLIDRLGARTTAFVTVLGTAVFYAIIPWLPSAPAVFVAFFFAGLLAGALEINLNVETDRLEGQFGKSFMNRAHGSWSLGFFITALLGASVRQTGISMEMHLAMVVTIVFVLGIFMMWGLTNAPKRANLHQGETPRIAFPTIGLLPLCLIGIAAFLVEGAGIDWSTIYMRDAFTTPVEPFVGGLALTLFSGCMAATRLLADPIVDRFGPRTTATSLLALAALGALAVSFAPAPWVALTGFALLGIGCSAVYPLAVSAAAQRTDRPSAVNVAALGQVTFVVFFLAPPLLGFVAEHLDIRTSYLVVLPIMVVGLIACQALGTRKAPTPAGLPPEPATPHG